ncbi:MAG: hypothetical protein KatS3mg014_1089 [Actinomycetota bacterium]|nr:MAG: hypothetical protein KatS3mg014_1089 [Actinomycetota bacterium]
MYVGLENIEPDTGRIVNLEPTPGARIASTKYRFDRRHVLYGKLRPYLNKVCAPDFEGICATDIVPLLPSPMRSRASSSRTCSGRPPSCGVPRTP